jgi:N-acetylmuramoyl-L-alanine amidase
MARVIVSSGHTQKEPGAIVGDLREVDLTRKIANKVISKLRQEGIISLSVPPEMDLLQRIDWINKTGYREDTEDIAVEIHINDGGKSGIEGWFKDKGENNSQKLTTAIVEEACTFSQLTNQGVKSEYEHPLKMLTFLHNISPVGALIECLYIDNPEDQKLLKDDIKIDQLASGIVKGILKYFGIENPVSAVPNVQPQQIPTPGQPFSPVLQKPMPYNPPPVQTQPYNPSYTPSWGWGGNQAEGGLAAPQDKEARKKMVQEKYQQILGRIVSDQDLNYFLNLGLTEDQMIRRLVESQEHADIVKDSQEYKKIKPDFDKAKMDNTKLAGSVKDKDEIIEKLNSLIEQKNISIHHLEQAQGHLTSSIQPPQITPGLLPPQQSQPATMTPRMPLQKESFFDRMLKKLNDIFD